MGTINIEVKELTTKEGFIKYKVHNGMDANVLEAMVGIAYTLCDIENDLPDADKQKFRSDFLQILNETRNGELYA